MREFFKMFFASVLAMVVGGVIIVIFFISMLVGLAKSVTDKQSKIEKGNVLVLDLSKRIHEQGESNAFAALGDGAAYDAGLYDMVKAISNAKTDNSIKGMYIKLAPSPNGWATLQQVRLAVEDFKTSKKFVYAYGENIPQNAYFVASAADSIYVNPLGNIELKGFATVMAYFKGTLEKLDLQPEIFFAGKFKSATEPFRADRISDPNREQIEGFQKSMWDEYLSAAAKYMNCEKAVVNRLAVTGAIRFPEDALKNRMVAGLLYWDQVESRIKDKAGKFSGEVKFMPLEDYVSTTKADGHYSDNRIAILVAEGEITDGEQTDSRQIASTSFCNEIRKIREDNRIKAVVLRVNSPGGSALASEVILRELTLLKKKKPIIVSMGDYAASGGYFISTIGDSVFALPNTITGSIGVFSMMFNISRMMKEKLGVTFDQVKNAPYADFPASHRPLTGEEAARMQESVDTIYSVFKRHVAAGRNLSMAKVDEIGQGRVWTGTDAKAIGLVDAMGGLGRALKSAAAKAKLGDYKVVTYPEPVDKVSMLLKKFKANGASEEVMKAALKDELGNDLEWYRKVQSLRDHQGKALMAMPFELSVN
jgi:protease IV